MLIGDSITEAYRHLRMLETYLAVCLPDLGLEVYSIDKGRETAEDFLKRIEAECLAYRPTAATICRGMDLRRRRTLHQFQLLGDRRPSAVFCRHGRHRVSDH